MAKNLKPGERVACYGQARNIGLANFVGAGAKATVTASPMVRSAWVIVSTDEAPHLEFQFHECQLRRLKKKKAPEFWVKKGVLNGEGGHTLYSAAWDPRSPNYVKVRLVKVKDEPTNKE